MNNNAAIAISSSILTLGACILLGAGFMARGSEAAIIVGVVLGLVSLVCWLYAVLALSRSSDTDDNTQ